MNASPASRNGRRCRRSEGEPGGGRSRWRRPEKSLRPGPQPPHDLRRRSGFGQSRGLPSPGLHPGDIALLQRGRPHRRRQAALDRIGSRRRRVRRRRGENVGVGDAAPGAAAERPADDRVLGRGARQGVRPGGMDPGLRATQKGGADLHRARSERQRRGDAASVGDAAGGDHRRADRIDDRGQQGEQADLPAFGLERIEAAAMPAGFRALRDNGVGARRRRRALSR